MNPRQLECLVALAEEQSFTRASQRLHVAQPQVSRQIAALERVVGATLFVRGPRSVTITPAGTVLLSYAREILSRMEEARRVTHDVGTGAAGKFRLAAVASGFSYVVPVLLRALGVEHPSIVPVVRTMEPPAQMHALRDRQIDVGILRDAPDGEDISFDKVMDEPLCVMLPAHHRLAQEQVIDLPMLSDEDFVLFPRHVAQFGFDFIVGHCLEAGFSPRIVAETPLDHVKTSLVAGGLGVSLVSWSGTQLSLPGVTYRPLRNSPRLPMHVAWLTDHHGPLVDRFPDLCRRHLVSVPSA